MQFDTFGTALASSYEMFTQALTGRYLATVAPGVDKSPAAHTRLMTDGHKLVRDFMRAATSMTDRYLDDISYGAPSYVLLQREASFLNALNVIVTKNMTDMMRRYKQTGGGLKTLLMGSAGAIGQLLQARLERPTFDALDTAGRKWQAGTLVKTLARDFAYQSFIDNQAAILAEQGDLAQVAHPDHAHHYQNMIVSLSGASTLYPSLESVRDTVFHHNARALLTHVST